MSATKDVQAYSIPRVTIISTLGQREPIKLADKPALPDYTGNYERTIVQPKLEQEHLVRDNTNRQDAASSDCAARGGQFTADTNLDDNYDGWNCALPVLPVPIPIQSGSSIRSVGGTPEQWMAAAGISAGDFSNVDYIISREGGWSGVTRWNTSGSGAYGLCQALPGSKMASAGADWQTNPVTQLVWCNSYAVSRYGSWGSAAAAWQRQNWW